MNIVNSASFKATVLITLSLGTILFFNLYERYIVSGSELLTDNQVVENLGELAHSSFAMPGVTFDSGVFRLHSDNAESIVGFSLKVPDVRHYQLLKLACDLRVLNVPHRQESWNTERVILVFFDHKGSPMYYLPHGLVNLSGTIGWKHFEAIFQVHPDTSRANIYAQLAQATGTMWVKNMSLLPLQESDSFHKLRNTAIILWILALLWITLPIIRSAIGNVHRTAIIALAITIMLGVLMPESIKTSIGNYLFPTLSASSGAVITTRFKFTPLIPTLDIYKTGHFILFALLAAVSCHGKSFPASRVYILLCFYLFALVTEVLQLFTSARTAQIGDVFIDSMGITMGFLLLYTVRIILSPRFVK